MSTYDTHTTTSTASSTTDSSPCHTSHLPTHLSLFFRSRREIPPRWFVLFLSGHPDGLKYLEVGNKCLYVVCFAFCLLVFFHTPAQCFVMTRWVWCQIECRCCHLFLDLRTLPGRAYRCCSRTISTIILCHILQLYSETMLVAALSIFETQAGRGILFGTHASCCTIFFFFFFFFKVLRRMGKNKA